MLIYYFTAISMAEVAIKALETKEVDGFLRKPFDLSDFNNIFEQLKPYNFT